MIMNSTRINLHLRYFKTPLHKKWNWIKSISITYDKTAEYKKGALVLL